MIADKITFINRSNDVNIKHHYVSLRSLTIHKTSFDQTYCKHDKNQKKKQAT